MPEAAFPGGTEEPHPVEVSDVRRSSGGVCSRGDRGKARKGLRVFQGLYSHRAGKRWWWLHARDGWQKAQAVFAAQSAGM